MNRRILAMLVAIVVAAAVVPMAQAAPPEHVPDRVDEALFRAELRKQNADAELARFDSLPPGQQRQLVGYLNDEELINQALTAPDGTSLAGGDIIVTVEYEEEEQTETAPTGFAMSTQVADAVNRLVADRQVAATYCCRTGYYSRYIHIFGVQILRATTWVQYKHNGRYAVSVVQSGSYYTNYHPLWSLRKSNWRPWISGGYAYGRTDWSITTGIFGYGVTQHSRQTVKSRPGYTTGWMG